MRTRKLPVLSLALLAAAVPAAAQAEREDAVDWGRVIESRRRDVIHPGDPMHLVGLEDGENEFRSSAPALLRADHEPVLVDQEENRARRLAMYADRASFRTPPRVDRIAMARAGLDDEDRPGPASPPEPVPFEDPRSPIAWLRIPAIVVAGLFAALWTRHRMMPRPE